MILRKHLAGTARFLLIFSALVAGQEQKTPQPQPQKETGLAAISSYTKSIDQFTKRNPKKRRIFGNVAGVEDEQDKWREFKSARKMEQADEGDNLDERAAVWLKEGKIVTAKFSFTSPSGDWAHYVNYYFRADGTLAKIHAQLNTFAASDGGMGVVRDKFYAANKRLLHTSTRYLDLKTQKPRKPGDFMDQPIPVYRTVRNLPFSKLL
jgi:hypothetical protein